LTFAFTRHQYVELPANVATKFGNGVVIRVVCHHHHHFILYQKADKRNL